MTVPRNSVVTLVAVACAAFLVADVAHEGLGHGGACLALGGKIVFLSTTYLDCTIRARLIDGAGPVVGLLVAAFAYAWLRLNPPRAIPARAFLALVFTFAGFWNLGYMIKSGLMNSGDWAYLIKGLAPAGLVQAELAVVGFVLYIVAIRLLAPLLERFATPEGMSASAFAWTAYLAAAALSAAGGYFDPRGPMTVLTDALPSSLGAVGLLFAAWRRPGLRIAVPFSPVWLAAGAASVAIFVTVLGPGLRL